MLISLLWETGSVYSQGKKLTDTMGKPITNIILTGDSSTLRIPISGVCKGYRELVIRYVQYTDVVAGVDKLKVAQKARTLSIPKAPLLQVHGNVMYSGLYRSVVDTPFTGNDLMQHTVQVYLDILWKQKYPFRIYLTNRFNNNNYFRNFFNFNFNYNPLDFAVRIKQQMVQNILQSETDSLKKIEENIHQNQNLIASLKKKWGSGDILQKIVEAREAALRKKLMKSDSTEGNSLPDIKKLDSLEIADKKKIDSIEKQMTALQNDYEKLKKATAINAQDINQIQTVSGLQQKLKEYHIADSNLPKGYKTLLAIKNIGIGRTMINYSELSAKNVSLTGLNIEYNPHLYYAFAAGVVDYRFVDYVVPNTPKLPSQYIVLGRIGFIQKENNGIFLTYYTGKRQLYNSVTAIPGNIPNDQLSGFTIEKRFQVNQNNYLVAEVAKSSTPYYSKGSLGQKESFNTLVDFTKRDNEAMSLKYFSNIPSTQTTIEANIKKIGAQFQSFSLFSTGSNQLSWSVKLNQLFLQKRLRLIATTQQNEYDNPLVGTTFKNTSLMMGIQATLHLKRMPVISAGFYPSSQTVKISSLSYTQTQFYTLTASASHFYRVQKIQMTSTLIFTQFYNHSNDTGFVYYNAKNLILSQTASLGKLNIQANISVSSNTDYNLNVYDGNIQYHIVKWLDVSGGIKYNYQSVYNISQWGYSSGITLSVSKLGVVRFQAEKGFIPGPNKQLVPNNIGMINYTTNF